MSKSPAVYWSGTGNTEAMANFVAEGTTSAGARVSYPLRHFSADKAANYDAIAFGRPATVSRSLSMNQFQLMWTRSRSPDRRSSRLIRG